MNIEDKLPADEVMREMAKLSMEQATSYFAAMARKFANSIPPECSGRDALAIFAIAIESTNTKVWPKGPAQS